MPSRRRGQHHCRGGLLPEPFAFATGFCHSDLNGTTGFCFIADVSVDNSETNLSPSNGDHSPSQSEWTILSINDQLLIKLLQAGGINLRGQIVATGEDSRNTYSPGVQFPGIQFVLTPVK